MSLSRNSAETKILATDGKNVDVYATLKSHVLKILPAKY